MMLEIPNQSVWILCLEIVHVLYGRTASSNTEKHNVVRKVACCFVVDTHEQQIEWDS